MELNFNTPTIKKPGIQIPGFNTYIPFPNMTITTPELSNQPVVRPESTVPTIITDPLMNAKVRNYYYSRYQASIGTELAGRVEGAAIGAAKGAYMGKLIGATVASLIATIAAIADNAVGVEGVDEAAAGSWLASNIGAIAAAATKGSKIGGKIGAAAGATIGTITADYTTYYATRDLVVDTVKQLYTQPGRGILNTLGRIGKSMDVIGGGETIRASLYALVNDDDPIAHICKAYGLDYTGRQTYDFENIRKSLGIDLTRIPNFLMDMVGDMVTDPGVIANFGAMAAAAPAKKAAANMLATGTKNGIEGLDNITSTVAKSANSINQRLDTIQMFSDRLHILVTDKKYSKTLSKAILEDKFDNFFKIVMDDAAKEYGKMLPQDLEIYMEVQKRFFNQAKQELSKTTSYNLYTAFKEIDDLDDFLTARLRNVFLSPLGVVDYMRKGSDLLAKAKNLPQITEYSKLGKLKYFILGNRASFDYQRTVNVKDTFVHNYLINKEKFVNEKADKVFYTLEDGTEYKGKDLYKDLDIRAEYNKTPEKLRTKELTESFNAAEERLKKVSDSIEKRKDEIIELKSRLYKDNLAQIEAKMNSVKKDTKKYDYYLKKYKEVRKNINDLTDEYNELDSTSSILQYNKYYLLEDTIHYLYIINNRIKYAKKIQGIKDSTNIKEDFKQIKETNRKLLYDLGYQKAFDKLCEDAKSLILGADLETLMRVISNTRYEILFDFVQKSIDDSFLDTVRKLYNTARDNYIKETTEISNRYNAMYKEYIDLTNMLQTEHITPYKKLHKLEEQKANEINPIKKRITKIKDEMFPEPPKNLTISEYMEYLNRWEKRVDKKLEELEHIQYFKRVEPRETPYIRIQLSYAKFDSDYTMAYRYNKYHTFRKIKDYINEVRHRYSKYSDKDIDISAEEAKIKEIENKFAKDIQEVNDLIKSEYFKGFPEDIDNAEYYQEIKNIYDKEYTSYAKQEQKIYDKELLRQSLLEHLLDYGFDTSKDRLLPAYNTANPIEDYIRATHYKAFTEAMWHADSIIYGITEYEDSMLQHYEYLNSINTVMDKDSNTAFMSRAIRLINNNFQGDDITFGKNKGKQDFVGFIDNKIKEKESIIDYYNKHGYSPNSASIVQDQITELKKLKEFINSQSNDGELDLYNNFKISGLMFGVNNIKEFKDRLRTVGKLNFEQARKFIIADGIKNIIIKRIKEANIYNISHIQWHTHLLTTHYNDLLNKFKNVIEDIMNNKDIDTETLSKLMNTYNTVENINDAIFDHVKRVSILEDEIDKLEKQLELDPNNIKLQNDLQNLKDTYSKANEALDQEREYAKNIDTFENFDRKGFVNAAIHSHLDSIDNLMSKMKETEYVRFSDNIKIILSNLTTIKNFIRPYFNIDNSYKYLDNYIDKILFKLSDTLNYTVLDNYDDMFTSLLFEPIHNIRHILNIEDSIVTLKKYDVNIKSVIDNGELKYVFTDFDDPKLNNKLTEFFEKYPCIDSGLLKENRRNFLNKIFGVKFDNVDAFKDSIKDNEYIKKLVGQGKDGKDFLGNYSDEMTNKEFNDMLASNSNNPLFKGTNDEYAKYDIVSPNYIVKHRRDTTKNLRGSDLKFKTIYTIDTETSALTSGQNGSRSLIMQLAVVKTTYEDDGTVRTEYFNYYISPKSYNESLKNGWVAEEGALKTSGLNPNDPEYLIKIGNNGHIVSHEEMQAEWLLLMQKMQSSDDILVTGHNVDYDLISIMNNFYNTGNSFIDKNGIFNQKIYNRLLEEMNLNIIDTYHMARTYGAYKQAESLSKEIPEIYSGRFTNEDMARALGVAYVNETIPLEEYLKTWQNKKYKNKLVTVSYIKSDGTPGLDSYINGGSLHDALNDALLTSLWSNDLINYYYKSVKNDSKNILDLFEDPKSFIKTSTDVHALNDFLYENTKYGNGLVGELCKAYNINNLDDFIDLLNSYEFRQMYLTALNTHISITDYNIKGVIIPDDIEHYNMFPRNRNIFDKDLKVNDYISETYEAQLAELDDLLDQAEEWNKNHNLIKDNIMSILYGKKNNLGYFQYNSNYINSMLINTLVNNDSMFQTWIDIFNGNFKNLQRNGAPQAFIQLAATFKYIQDNNITTPKHISTYLHYMEQIQDEATWMADCIVQIGDKKGGLDVFYKMLNSAQDIINKNPNVDKTKLENLLVGALNTVYFDYCGKQNIPENTIYYTLRMEIIKRALDLGGSSFVFINSASNITNVIYQIVKQGILDNIPVDFKELNSKALIAYGLELAEDKNAESLSATFNNDFYSKFNEAMSEELIQYRSFLSDIKKANRNMRNNYVDLNEFAKQTGKNPYELIVDNQMLTLKYTYEKHQDMKLSQKINRLFDDLYKSNSLKTPYIIANEEKKSYEVLKTIADKLGLDVDTLVLDSDRRNIKRFSKVFDFYWNELLNSNDEFVVRLNNIIENNFSNSLDYITDIEEYKRRFRNIYLYNYIEDEITKSLEFTTNKDKDLKKYLNSVTSKYISDFINDTDTKLDLENRVYAARYNYEAFTDANVLFQNIKHSLYTGSEESVRRFQEYFLNRKDMVIVTMDHKYQITKMSTDYKNIKNILQSGDEQFAIMSKDEYYKLMAKTQPIVLPKILNALHKYWILPSKLFSLYFSIPFLIKNVSTAVMQNTTSNEVTPFKALSNLIDTAKTYFKWKELYQEGTANKTIFNLMKQSDIDIDWFELVKNKDQRFIDGLLSEVDGAKKYAKLLDFINNATPEEIEKIALFNELTETNAVFADIISEQRNETIKTKKNDEYKYLKDKYDKGLLEPDTPEYNNFRRINHEPNEGFNSWQDEINYLEKKKDKEAWEWQRLNICRKNNKPDKYVELFKKFQDYTFMKKWLNINEDIEVIFRLSMLRDSLDVGQDLSQATEHVMKTHFIYNDKSVAERLLEVIIPFASYPIKATICFSELTNDYMFVKYLYEFNKYSWGDEEYAQSDYLTKRKAQGDVPIGDRLFGLGNAFTETIGSLLNPKEAINNKLNPVFKPAVDLATNAKYNRAGQLTGPLYGPIRSIQEYENSGTFHAGTLLNVSNNYYRYQSNAYRNIYQNYPRRSNYLYNNLYTRSGYSRVKMHMQNTTLQNVQYRVGDILYQAKLHRYS